MRRICGIALLAVSLTAVAEESSEASGAQQQSLPMLDARLGELSSLLTRLQAEVNNSGWLNLLNQLESLKTDVARLRGAQEEMAYRQQQSDQRQKDVLADFDARLKEVRELASRPLPVVVAAASAPTSAATAPTAPAEPPRDPEAETRAYEAALNLFKSADRAGAVNAFGDFLARYPDSPLAGNAMYWLGLTYFAMADHKNAVATQERLLHDYPQHAKVPDAMVNLARGRIQLGETEEARRLLEDVVARYPATRSAELAGKILSLFK